MITRFLVVSLKPVSSLGYSHVASFAWLLTHVASKWKLVPGWGIQNSALEIWCWTPLKVHQTNPIPRILIVNLPKRILDTLMISPGIHNISHPGGSKKIIPKWFPVASGGFLPKKSPEAEGSSFHVVAQGETNSFATIIPNSHTGGDHFWCFLMGLFEM